MKKHLWAYMILTLAAVAVYSNNFHHPFHLDSTHGLVQNPFVRSFSWVPRFFIDPLTLTSYQANGDYRPILQITYVLNYLVSGYSMWSWHLVQILLHLVVAAFLFRFLRRLGSRFDVVAAGPVAFWIALIFVLHPTHSGVVNYQWARSSLLVAALLMPAFDIYLKRINLSSPGYLPLLLYGLALWTKVEAIGALAVFGALLWWAPASSKVPDLKGPKDLVAFLLATLRRLMPFVIVTLIYAVIRISIVPDFTVEMRQAASITPLQYLITQFTAWWHYLGRWIWPFDLIADDTSYPIYGSIFELKVLWSLALLALFGTLALTWWRHQKHLYLILFMSGAALLSPHSSFMPLAEMVNEHRPYLPFAMLMPILLIPLFSYLYEQSGFVYQRRWLLCAAMLGLCLCLATMTWKRNQVFASDYNYWQDIVTKAPSARSHLNFGLVLASRNDLQGALEHYQKSLDLAPYWLFIHVNMALLKERLGNQEEAWKHFDFAVDYDRYSSLALKYRGQFHHRQGRLSLAMQDYYQALERESYPCDLIQTLWGMGVSDPQLDDKATSQCGFKVDQLVPGQPNPR